VKARHTYDDILDGLRAGRIFVVAGDLISELDVTAESGDAKASMGGTLPVRRGEDVRIVIRFRIPSGKNAHGDVPKVERADLIIGDVHGPAVDRNLDINESTAIL
jgi:hypothetical protein